MEERTGEAFELGEKLTVVGRKLPARGVGRCLNGQSRGRAEFALDKQDRIE